MAEFATYHYQKTVDDDIDIFPVVARIPDVMLLSDATTKGTSKKRRGSKKKVQESPPHVSLEKVSKKSYMGDNVSKKKDPPLVITEPIVHEEEPVLREKEVVAPKSGVIKRLTKITHNPSPTLQYKKLVTRKGVVFCEVQTPVSAQSKKRCANDIAKHLSTKQNKHKNQRNLVLHENSTDEYVVSETPITEKIGHSSPVRDSPFQSIFKETNYLDGNVKTLTVDTTVNHAEQHKSSTLE